MKRSQLYLLGTTLLASMALGAYGEHIPVMKLRPDSGDGGSRRQESSLERATRRPDPGRTLEIPSKRSLPGVFRSDSQFRPFRTKDGARGLAAPGASVSIDGYAINADSWTSGNEQYGVYSLPIYGTMHSLDKVCGGMQGEAAVYCDGKLWVQQLEYFYGYLTGASSVTYDTETWAVVASNPSSPYTMRIFLSTVDPTTDTPYVYGAYNNHHFSIGKFDIESETYTEIANAGTTNAYTALACDNAGTLYAVKADGTLVTLDKSTGQATAIGPTGLISEYITAAVIDPATGMMYYGLCNSTENALYQINPADASSVKLYDMPDDEEFSCFFLPAATTADAAPAHIEDFDIDFATGSLSGTVSFTAPSTLFDGTAASGSLEYTVKVNDEQYTGSTSYGASVSVPVQVPSSGVYAVEAYTSNSAGNGPAVKSSLWIGSDMPTPAEDVTLVYENGRMKLSWQPSRPANNGYMDPSQVTYKVVRYPGPVTVSEAQNATYFEEEMPVPDRMTTYWYEVTPSYNGLSAETTRSNNVSLGDIVPPYRNDFETRSSFENFTIINVNGDRMAWIWEEGYARYDYSEELPADDWLVLPGARLEGGKLYRFSADIYSMNDKYPEKFSFAVGRAPEVEALTTELLPETVICQHDPINFESYYIAPEDGVYYFAIHATSDANMYSLFVDFVDISAPMSAGIPAAVSGLTATPAAHGALEATLSFTAPDKDMSGKTLQSIDRIELYRDGELFETVTSPAPGSTHSVTDHSAVAGNNTYTVAAFNADGQGPTSLATVFVGFSAPLDPTNVTGKPGQHYGQVVVTWDPVTEDVNGAPLEPGEVTYTVARYENREAEVIADNLTEPVWTDNYCDATAEQKFMQYVVRASTSAGNSRQIATGLIPVGAPYTLPFAESLAGGKSTYACWGTNLSGDALCGLATGGDIADMPTQDGDGGMFYIRGYEDEYASFFTGRINVSDPEAVLTFYYAQIGSNRLQVFVNDGTTDECVADIRMDGSSSRQWVKFSCPLAQYAGKDIQLTFLGTINDYRFIFFDNIRIDRAYERELSVRSIASPMKVNAGEALEVDINIANEGSVKAENYTVTLFCNGEQAAEAAGEAIEPAADGTVHFELPVGVFAPETLEVHAVVNFEGDQNPGNNTSETRAVTVIYPAYAAVDDLSASVKGDDVELSWSKPTASSEIFEPVTDGVEDYTAFSIGLDGSAVPDDNVGDWTMINADGERTFGIADENDDVVRFPNAGKAMAFIVFKPGDYGLDSQGLSCFEGEQMFVALESVSRQNDDWMISPELSGRAQTVSFWAKSAVTHKNLEQFEFYYSTGGKEISDFVRVDERITVPASWTLYNFEIPDGAVYFAIRCVTYNGFALLVDEITYTPGNASSTMIDLLGYNVYRDRVRINSDIVTGTTYIDAAPSKEKHTYHVTAVYDRGESVPSNGADANLSGINDLRADGIGVYADGSDIVVTGAAGRTIRVFTADGVVQAETTGSDVTRIPSTKGIHLVGVAGHTVKVIVR